MPLGLNSCVYQLAYGQTGYSYSFQEATDNIKWLHQASELSTCSPSIWDS